MYVKRLPYTEELIVEIFGEYLFERDLTPPGYKLVNACQLAVPVICRSMFFRLVNPMGKGNYSKLSNWLFSDPVAMKQRTRKDRWYKFANEQIIGALSEYRPTSEDMKEFRLLAAIMPEIAIPGFLGDEASIAAYLAILDGSISREQVEWLYKYQKPPVVKPVNLPLPGFPE